MPDIYFYSQEIGSEIEGNEVQSGFGNLVSVDI